MDQAVQSVSYVKGDTTKGALITIVNKEKLAMPVTIKITQVNGTTETINFPVNIWQRSGIWMFKYPSITAIKSIVIDPGKVLPDVDYSNNVWGKE